LRDSRAVPVFGAARGSPNTNPEERSMASKETGVYRITEIVGTSKTSWDDAAKNAVETAAKTLRDLRIAEITKLDCRLENGKVVAYRARVSLSFKYGS
jgi:flavin-binding protein dodecin